MRARLALIGVMSLAIGGCGEDRDDAARTVPQRAVPVPAVDSRAVAVASVSLVDYALEGVTPRVPRPGVVAFEATNDGTVRHALAVDGPAGPISTSPLRPGEQGAFAVRLPRGTYKWYCPLADHEGRGMAGRVRVAE